LVSIPIIIGLGLVAIFTFLFVRDAAATSLGQAGTETGLAIGAIGQGIGQAGSGIGAFGQGIGAGITGLFAPLLFFKELIFGNEPIVISGNPNTVQAGNSGAIQSPVMPLPGVGPGVGGLIGPPPI